MKYTGKKSNLKKKAGAESSSQNKKALEHQREDNLSKNDPDKDINKVEDAVFNDTESISNDTLSTARLSPEEYWSIIEPLTENTSVMVYDLDIPKGSNSFLRVYIYPKIRTSLNENPEVKDSDENGTRYGGVGHEDCVNISRQILDHPRVEELLPGNTQLEVSSPGVNRLLSRPEHFRLSLGEKVAVTGKFDSSDEDSVLVNRTLQGILKSFVFNSANTDGTLHLIEEGSGRKFSIKYNNIKKARIEFDFREAVSVKI